MGFKRGFQTATALAASIFVAFAGSATAASFTAPGAGVGGHDDDRL